MSHPQAITQEADRLAPRLTLGVTAWVVLFGSLLCVVAHWVLSARTHSLARPTTTPRASPVAGEVNNLNTGLFREPAAGELRKQKQRAALRSYAWVDRAHGIVKIPIDVAMELEISEAKP